MQNRSTTSCATATVPEGVGLSVLHARVSG